jgi:hypothetical protein
MTPTVWILTMTFFAAADPIPYEGAFNNFSSEQDCVAEALGFIKAAHLNPFWTIYRCEKYQAPLSDEALREMNKKPALLPWCDEDSHAQVCVPR